MTFHAKGLFTLVGFAAILWVGVQARAGNLDPIWAIAGAAAYVVVEAVMFFGPASVKGRARSN